MWSKPGILSLAGVLSVAPPFVPPALSSFLLRCRGVCRRSATSLPHSFLRVVEGLLLCSALSPLHSSPTSLLQHSAGFAVTVPGLVGGLVCWLTRREEKQMGLTRSSVWRQLTSFPGMPQV